MAQITDIIPIKIMDPIINVAIVNYFFFVGHYFYLCKSL